MLCFHWLFIESKNNNLAAMESCCHGCCLSAVLMTIWWTILETICLSVFWWCLTVGSRNRILKQTYEWYEYITLVVSKVSYWAQCAWIFDMIIKEHLQLTWLLLPITEEYHNDLLVAWIKVSVHRLLVPTS